MYGLSNIKFASAKQAKEILTYKNIKRGLSLILVCISCALYLFSFKAVALGFDF